MFEKIHLHFESIQKAQMADKVFELANNKIPFAIKLTHRIVLFNPTTLTALDLPSKSSMQFISLTAMMGEVSGLLFIAKDILVPKERQVTDFSFLLTD